MKDIHIKISDQEHAEFLDACKSLERTITDVLREKIRDFIAQEKLSNDFKKP